METTKLWTLEMIDSNDMIAVVLDDSHIGTGTNRPHVEVEHTHEFFELEYIVSGSGIQIINGVEIPVRRGDVLFFDIGDTHGYYAIENFLVVNCIFYPEFWDKELKDKVLGISKCQTTKLNNIINLSGSGMIEFENIIDKIDEELRGKQPEYKTAVRGYFNLLFVMLMRAGLFTKNKKDARLSAIMEYVSENWQTASLGTVARRFGYNPSYLSTMFKQATGLSFTGYVNQRRIREAVLLLENTSQTVDDIIHEVGFEDKKHFYALFKQHMGVTPRSIPTRREVRPITGGIF